MPNIPAVSGNKLIKVLIKKGFALNRVNGSHHILVDTKNKITISVPVHQNQSLGRGITLAILKDAGINIEEFLKLLKKS